MNWFRKKVKQLTCEHTEVADKTTHSTPEGYRAKVCKRCGEEWLE